jgi:hypothetical protein
MKTFQLPKSISCLADQLNIVQMVWHGVYIQIPKFAIYATLSSPVFDQIVYRNGRQIGVLNFGRYQVPVLDPFKGDIDPCPNLAIIINISRGNRFGLYGYPADTVETDIQLAIENASVSRIIKDYV